MGTGKEEALRARVAALEQELAALREAEEALVEERNYSRMLVEGANALVVGLDTQGRVTIFNRAAEEITGYRRADLHGRDWFEVLVPRERYPEVWEEFLKLKDTRVPDDFENPILTASGEERIIAWRNSILRVGDTFVGTLSFGIDITGRRRAEEALRESEARTRSILETAPVGILVVDGEGRILLVNARAEELFGYRREELLAKGVEILLPEPLRAVHVAHRATYLADPRARQMGRGRDLSARRKDGSEFPVEIGLSSVRGRDGILVVSFITDITERRRAAEALERQLQEVARLSQEIQAQGEFIRNVLESLRDGVVVLDRGGRVVAWNRAMQTATGLPAEAARGKSILELFPTLTREGLAGEVERLLRGEIEQVALKAVELESPRKGTMLLNIKGSLLQEDGGPAGAALLIEDITELAGLERAARQAEKMAAIGTLSAGLAHEINNPIGIIASRVECMLLEAEEHRLSETVRSDLQVIARHTGRVARITQGLLSLSRQQAWQLTPVDLNSVVEEALVLMERQLAREAVALERDLAPGLPAVLGSATHLQQVLLNLLTNAREAMPEGGCLRVATRRRGRSVEVEVTDTGRGIPPAHLPTIFDPFFTTKEKGTGLGLAISYGLVRDHGGTLTVQSREGKGTTFLVALPVAEQR